MATENGFDVLVPHAAGRAGGADTVVVPGIGDRAWPLPPEPVEALRAAAKAARASRRSAPAPSSSPRPACSTAAARPRTGATPRCLTREFPAVEVDPDVLYVDEGDVLTSAGVAAGIDLCLHIVRKDHGAEVANGSPGASWWRPTATAARRSSSSGRCRARRRAAATRAWMEERLDEQLTVEDMARHAACSPRSFARRFRAETGTTPLQWLIGRRVAEAQRLLEGSELPVEQVASLSGFGTAAALRQHFGARSTSPTAYRRASAAARALLAGMRRSGRAL